MIGGRVSPSTDLAFDASSASIVTSSYKPVTYTHSNRALKQADSQFAYLQNMTVDVTMYVSLSYHRLLRILTQVCLDPKKRRPLYVHYSAPSMPPKSRRRKL